jgi:hypothetical protein
MRTIHLQLFFFIIGFSMMFFSCQVPEKTIEVSNASTNAFVEEGVVISRAELEAWLGEIPAAKLPLLVTQAGDTIAVQHDDMTGDGEWDELFCLMTLSPQSMEEFALVWVSPDELPVFQNLTNIRFSRIEGDEYIPIISAIRLTADEGLAAGIYQMEGPAWENDIVGFRNYFDVRNGMDIFGKTTTEMVLDRVGINEDYHVLQPWGMDILKVGTSLGAGSIALEKAGRLFRVAPEAASSYELITEGPLRSVFRLRFDSWDVEGQTYNLVHDISIRGGAWFYTSRVYLEGHQGEATIISGITTVDLENKESVREYRDDDVAFVATHGAQAYDGENLGMAIMVQAELYGGFEYIGAGEDITDTFIVKMPVKDDQAAVFRFYACWELSDRRFADKANFHAFLQQQASIMSLPLKVSFN